MKTINTCCGSFTRRRVAILKEPVQPNPKVYKGVAVIFVGQGSISIKGTASGSVYYASDHHRHFKVFNEDSKDVLKRKDVILDPS